MRSKNLFWGVFLLLSAGLIIASQFVSFATIGTLSVLATVFLAAIIIHSLVDLEYFGIFVSVAFLYMIYSGPLDLKHINHWILLASAVLLSTGCSMIFRKRPKKVTVSYGGHDHTVRSAEDIDDNNPYAKVSLGSSSKYLHSECLQGGHFIVSLGELDVYFDHVQLSPQGAEVFVDCSLGTMKLYIPRTWHVVDNIHPSLGEVKNNNRFFKAPDTAPKLTLSGNVSLGTLEINYI